MFPDRTNSRRRRFWCFAAIAAAALLACGAGAVLATAASAPAVPRRLHDTGLYEDGTGLVVQPEILTFSPQYPLWSDGAEKQRWIRLPRGKSVDASRAEAWSFPAGTRLWKLFKVRGRPVETRYLERLRDGRWRYATYVWNEAGTEAVLAPEAGLARELEPGSVYKIPGAVDCRVCHEGSGTPVLGFSALQLSPDRDPLAPHAEPVRPGEVDLRTLVERGLVRGLPASLRQRPPRIPAATPAGRAALGYLHANCGGCHNGAGPLASVGLILAHALGSSSPEDLPALRTTVGHPVKMRIPGVASEGLARITPGAPDLSAIVLRARSRHALLQMPPLGTSVVDQEAVGLLERWITDLPSVLPQR